MQAWASWACCRKACQPAHPGRLLPGPPTDPQRSTPALVHGIDSSWLPTAGKLPLQRWQRVQPVFQRPGRMRCKRHGRRWRVRGRGCRTRWGRAILQARHSSALPANLHGNRAIKSPSRAACMLGHTWLTCRPGPPQLRPLPSPSRPAQPRTSCRAGIQHPVEAAALLAREGRQPLSYGRVRPM